MKYQIDRLLILCGVLLTLAPQAQALKLEGFNIKQRVLQNQYPAIHVKFDRAADNWTVVTKDDVRVLVEYEIEVKATYALAPGSKVSINLDNMDAEEPLQSTNNHYGETHWGSVELRRDGSALNEIKAAALDTCQKIRGNGGKPSKEYRVPKTFQVSGYAEASTTATWYTEGEAHDTALARIDVVCDLDPDWHEPIEPVGDGFSADLGKFRPRTIELFLTTYQNQVTHPTPGTTCKKLEVKVRIEANKEGPLTYKLWRQPGEAVSKMKMITLQQNGPFKGRFIAEDTYWITFDKTTYIQFMAEVGGTPVGISTPWKDINIICGGNGTGGLTGEAPPGADNSAGGLIAPFKVIDANIILRKISGAACPAHVTATVTYRTNKPGSFEHYVGCSNGFSNGGTMQVTQQTGASVYGITRVFNLTLSQPAELICSARGVEFASELAIKKLLVQCGGTTPSRKAAPAVPPPPPPPPKRIKQR
jgi:hypothetical protein